MIATNSVDFGIYQLPCSSASNNRYIYIDSIDGALEMKNNKWFLNLNYYVIMSATLPVNMLTTNITLPFATVEDISLIRNLYGNIPSWITLKNYCAVYQTNTELDIGDSKFFQEQLTNFDMYLLFDFKCDSEVINKTSFCNSPNITDMFVNEWAIQKQKIEFNYSNYVKVEDNKGWFDNCNSYYLTSKNNSYGKQSIIYYTMNNVYDELKKPLCNLLSIKTDNPITITHSSYNFYYSVGSENKIHKYSYEDKNKYFVSNDFDVNFDGITSYDDTTQDVVTNLSGNKGFYIPTRSSGYFEVELQILQDGNYRVYCFHKSFSFSSESYYDRTITVKEILFDSIANFKRMMF